MDEVACRGGAWVQARAIDNCPRWQVGQVTIEAGWHHLSVLHTATAGIVTERRCALPLTLALDKIVFARNMIVNDHEDGPGGACGY